jgi:hypothetical protein
MKRQGIPRSAIREETETLIVLLMKTSKSTLREALWTAVCRM